MEQKLVQILKEEVGDTPRYWNGKYVHVAHKKGRIKKRFQNEVSKAVKDYTLSLANVRFKFFLHFGTDAEIQRETQWIETFDPFGRLHVDRNGKYDRKSVQ